MKNISLQIQTILYNNDKNSLIRSIESISRAVQYSKNSGMIQNAVIRYGDSSKNSLFTEKEVCELNVRFDKIVRIEYNFFNANLGSARGQNTLAESTDAEYLFLINPDILLAYDVFQILLEPFEEKNGNVGITECKQIPVEHPKEFDRKTGQTSWASGACTFIKTDIFREVGKYDADSFFMYCDDVDLSWRVRLAGYKVLYRPAAAVFHDKRFSSTGNWMPSSAEVYYSAEAALIMAYKWSRKDLLDKYIEDFLNADEDSYHKAVEDFKNREKAGQLPVPIDPEHKICEFVQNNYGKMRFVI